MNRNIQIKLTRSELNHLRLAVKLAAEAEADDLENLKDMGDGLDYTPERRVAAQRVKWFTGLQDRLRDLSGKKTPAYA